jgi:hypothetical protein
VKASWPANANGNDNENNDDEMINTLTWISIGMMQPWLTTGGSAVDESSVAVGLDDGKLASSELIMTEIQ